MEADFLFQQPPLVLLAPVTKGWVDQSIFKCKSIVQPCWGNPFRTCRYIPCIWSTPAGFRCDNGKWINDSSGDQFQGNAYLNKEIKWKKTNSTLWILISQTWIVPCSSLLPERRQRSTVNLPLLLELAGYLLFMQTISLILYTHMALKAWLSVQKFLVISLMQRDSVPLHQLTEFFKNMAQFFSQWLEITVQLIEHCNFRLFPHL